MQLHSHSLLQLFKHNLVYILWKGRDLYFSYFDVMGRWGLGGEIICATGKEMPAVWDTLYLQIYLPSLGHPTINQFTCTVWDNPLAS